MLIVTYHNSQEMETNVSVHQLMNGQKKCGILSFITIWMNLETIMLSEKSQAQKDKYCMNSLMWNIRKCSTEVESKIVILRGWRK